jgi:hypothetical protein
MDKQPSQKEIAKRRDEALKRALNMPPQPHKKKEPAEKTGSHVAKRPSAKRR